MYIIYSNFGAHIRPPRCTLPGGCLEEWPKVYTTLQMTFRGTQKLIKIDIPQFLPLCTSHIQISVHTSGWWASHQLVAVQNSGPGYMQHSSQPLGVLRGQYKLILATFYLYVHYMFTFQSTHQAGELHINRWLLRIVVREIYTTVVKLLGHWAAHWPVGVYNSGPRYMQHSGQILWLLRGQYKLIYLSFCLYIHHIFKFRCTCQASELHINWWLFRIVPRGICNTPVKI